MESGKSIDNNASGRRLVKGITKMGFSNSPFPLPKEPHLNDFFTVIKSPVVTYVIFQFGLRSDLPLMDILYLEFLHSFLKKGEIKNIIIFPSIDLSAPKQGKDYFKAFERNIKKIFKGYEPKIEVCDPLISTSIDNNDLTSLEFLATLNYLGSEEYFSYLKNGWNLNILSINDFNKYHPADGKILTLFTHIIGAWQVIKYIKENIIPKSRGDLMLELGFILWQTEVDKLGVYNKYANEIDKIKLSAFLGKTIMDTKKKPLPAFINDDAINLFQNIYEQFDKIRKINDMSESMIKKSILILEVILQDNYPSNDDNSEAKNNPVKDGKRIVTQAMMSGLTPAIHFKYPNLSYRFISLLGRLMSIYSGQPI